MIALPGFLYRGWDIRIKIVCNNGVAMVAKKPKGVRLELWFMDSDLKWHIQRYPSNAIEVTYPRLTTKQRKEDCLRKEWEVKP